MGEIIRMLIGIQAPFNMIVLVSLFVFAAMTISSMASEVRKYFCFRDEVDLKRELVARGITTEELDVWLKPRK